MILIDTSVWIHYLRDALSAPGLPQLLKEDQAASHPWIIGELMVGSLGPNRREILFGLWQLPQSCEVYPIEELEEFIEEERLFATGLSLIDAQLLYGAVKDRYRLWTFDKALRKAAEKFSRAYSP